MKYLCPFLLAVLILTGPGIAQEVAIEGPDKMDVGSRPIRLDVTGATVTDLVEGEAKLILYPRENAETWDAATWTGRPYVLFFADRPGRYLIALAFARSGSLVYCEHEIEVGGGGPNPPPPPEPGKRFVLVIQETADRTPEEMQTILGLQAYLKSKSHPCRIEDPDLLQPGTNQPPEWFRTYLKILADRKVQIPALVVGVMTNDSTVSTVYADPLPASAEEAIALVKKYGG